MSSHRILACRQTTALALALLVCSPVSFLPARGEDTSAPGVEPAWKLTAGRYAYSAGSPGTDLNLRYSQDQAHLWLGHFSQPGEDVHQWRAGWDQSFFEQVRVQPSAQVASGGFAGGSLGFETGASWFVGAGLGRTNLRPYYNLNFDPNDSYTLSAGWRGEGGTTVSTLWVRDNRINPDQRHLHLLGQWLVPQHQRISLDVLYKQGLVNGTAIHRCGATLTYDWPGLFVRVAYDPQTNFTPVDALRVSVGTRF